MTHFQLIDYLQRNDLELGDPSYQWYSYGELMFPLDEFLEKFKKGADRQAARDNPMGLTDMSYEIHLLHREQQMDISIQSYLPVSTLSGQMTDKLVHMMVQVGMPDVELDQAVAIMLPRSASGWYPQMVPFTNSGSLMHGNLICDRSRFCAATTELKASLMNLPPDHVTLPNATEHKPPIYMMVHVVKLLPDRPDLCLYKDKKGSSSDCAVDGL